MKLIVAIVRPDRVSVILEALYKAEVQGLTLSRVQGHGGEREQVETYRGMTVKMELSEKVRLEIGVSEPLRRADGQGRSSAARAPAKSATARCSCCPSSRSTASAPARWTRPPSRRCRWSSNSALMVAG